jgi:hypothetical protein
MSQRQSRYVRGATLLISLFLFAVTAFGQAPPSTVSFTFDFPGSQPDHYIIAVSPDGQATYDSSGRFDNDSEPPEDFKLKLTLSPSTAQRVFDLSKRANYFQGKVDSGKKNLASTGTKTLAYQDGQRSTTATYNYSQNPVIQNLTALFQNLSTTLEFGRRIEFYRRYQKLALDDELKRLEAMSKQNSIEELSALGPILQQIANDQSMINPVRMRAERLLAKGSTPK